MCPLFGLEGHVVTLGHMQIIAYNCTEDSQYAQYWDFSGLHHFFQQMASKEEFQAFFDKILPFIIRVSVSILLVHQRKLKQVSS